MACELFVNRGTSTQVRVDFKNSTNLNINLADSELFAFGIDVPQNIPFSLIDASSTGSYILLNTATQTSGFLRGFELYAHTAGLINLAV